MNLEHLRMLVVIAEQGSLSSAARVMRISQPAVTKQVQRLESELGIALLVRGPRRQISLTPAGERVLAFARETLNRFEGLERELAEFKAVGPGVLILAASTIPGEYLLPSILGAFRREYPQIHVQMTVADTAEVVAKVLAEEAEVGVIGSAIQRPGLRLEPLASDEIVLAVPLTHPFAERREVRVEELKGQPLILRERGSGTQHSVEKALEKVAVSLSEEDIVLTLGSTQALLQAVEQGLGLGFVSARACAQAQVAGRLTCARLTGVNLSRHLYLAYLSSRAGDPLVSRFLEFARAYAQNHFSSNPLSVPSSRMDSKA
mgnify:CR=1 FL=1